MFRATFTALKGGSVNLGNQRLGKPERKGLGQSIEC